MNVEAIEDGKRSVIFVWGDHGPSVNVLPPPGWVRAEVRADGCSWVNKHRGLAVIMSIAKEEDGKFWAHVSCSHRNRLPTYDEMAKVKSAFLGDDRYAISVLPPKQLHVNLHPFCLHLWSCLDGHPLPEFSNGTGSI